MEDRLGDSLGPPTKTARPQSTIAQEFAAEMDNLLHTSMNPLEQKVEEKKLGVDSAQQELLELEARLKDAEQKLAKVSRQPSPARPPQYQPPPPPPSAAAVAPQQTGSNAPVRAPPPVPGGAGDYASPAMTDNYATAGATQSDFQQPPAYAAPRPPTGARENTQQMMSHMPGAMPMDTPTTGARTPATPAGDYVMVQNEGNQF